MYALTAARLTLKGSEMAVAAESVGENVRSFDPLASVRMMQYDLDMFGQVLPETRERVADEELSYLVEGMDRVARTTFVLERQNDELVYFDKGQWRPYMSLLCAGLETAEQEADEDSRLQFLANRAATDLRQGYVMQSLRPGQTVSWYSPYPKKEAEYYGEGLLRSRGFATHREMGFLYRAECLEDGSVVLESQTVDRSNESAFIGAMEVAETVADADMDTLVSAYDESLSAQLGGDFFAGRRDAEIGENAWTTLLEHKDLIHYLLDGLENIAGSEVASSEMLEQRTKRHVYGVWAAFKKRIDGVSVARAWHESYGAMPPALIHQEVQQAFMQFAAEGRQLIGCGGALSILQGEDAIMAASGRDVFDGIFGKRSDSESYSFDKFQYCVACQAPPKGEESKKMCGPCGLCRGCDRKATIKSEKQSSYALAA